MTALPEFRTINDAVNGLILKMNAGVIGRESIGDVLEVFMKQACLLNNALISTLPPDNEDGKMAFADLLYELSEDIRGNGGKIKFE